MVSGLRRELFAVWPADVDADSGWCQRCLNGPLQAPHYKVEPETELQWCRQDMAEDNLAAARRRLDQACEMHGDARVALERAERRVRGLNPSSSTLEVG